MSLAALHPFWECGRIYCTHVIPTAGSTAVGPRCHPTICHQRQSVPTITLASLEKAPLPSWAQGRDLPQVSTSLSQGLGLGSRLAPIWPRLPRCLVIRHRPLVASFVVPPALRSLCLRFSIRPCSASTVCLPLSHSQIDHPQWQHCSSCSPSRQHTASLSPAPLHPRRAPDGAPD
jgi:hypothetical protein